MFAREGLYFVVPSFIGNLFIILLLNFCWASVFPFYGLLYAPSLYSSTGYFVYFFRNPRRKPIGPGILSPSDGIITLIMQEENRTIIFIELMASNVHTQRSPVNAKVINVEKIKGKNNPIFLIHDRARENGYKIPLTKNARICHTLESEDGVRMKITQICGVFARRCRTRLNKGQFIKKGKTIGIIMFGSLVKFEIEGKYEVLVKFKDRVRAGHHVLLKKAC